MAAGWARAQQRTTPEGGALRCVRGTTAVHMKDLEFGHEGAAPTTDFGKRYYLDK
jgi:hypothetical protein